MIPVHAIATTNPQQLRWVVAPDCLPLTGLVRQAPGQLGTMLADGLVEELAVRATDVLITLRAGNDWRRDGDRVRDALADALLHLGDWRVDTPAHDPASLTEITTELLAGPIGEQAGSHGGSIELVSVSGTDVTVRMSGACHGCPAAASTLRDRLQAELRRRVDPQVTVSGEAPPATLSLGKKLLSLISR